jgi:hypothetical protein
MVQLNSIIQAGLNEMFLMSKDFENGYAIRMHVLFQL